MPRREKDDELSLVVEDLEREKLEEMKRRDHFVAFTQNGEFLPAKQLLLTEGISLTSTLEIQFHGGYRLGLFTDCPGARFPTADMINEVRLLGAQALRVALNAACSSPTFVPITMMVYMQLHNHYLTYFSNKYFRDGYHADMSVASGYTFDIKSCELLFEEYDIGPDRMYIDEVLPGSPEENLAYEISKKHSETVIRLSKDDPQASKDYAICDFVLSLRKAINAYLGLVMASGE